MTSVARSLVRISHTTDGQIVLKYLYQKIMNRVLGPDATSQELWYLEGQRALITHIQNLIQQGHQP